MTRRRIIDEELFSSEDLIEACPDDPVFLLFYAGLWVYAEDSGCFKWSPQYLKMKMFSGYDSVTTKQLKGYLEALETLRKVVRYEDDGKTYGWLTKFLKHQNVPRPSAPRLPLPPWLSYRGSETHGEARHLYRYVEDVVVLHECCPGVLHDAS